MTYTDEEVENIKKELISSVVTLIIAMVDKPTDDNVKRCFNMIYEIYSFIKEIDDKP